MKSLIQFTAAFLLLGGQVFSAHAGFSALYAFGDGVCTTTNNNSGLAYYYGKRFTNGRTWIEVLAQRQGLTYDSNKNWSYFGQDSTNVLTHVINFPTLPEYTNDLFVVWACDADFVGFLQKIYATQGTNLTAWNNAISLSLTNHFKIVTNLWAKGVRSLIVLNAVDLTKVPQYNGGLTSGGVSVGDGAFVRGRTIYFNTNLIATLNLAKSSCPGLKIYTPDIFNLLENVLTNAATYGLTNVLAQGNSIDAIDAVNYGYPAATTNGNGTNYIFWDSQDPTAKFHAVIADVVQQMISPVQFSGLAQVGSSNRLDVVNMPVGMSGSVLSATSLTQVNWLTNSPGFTGTNILQSVFVPASGAQKFYRLQFPWQWTWP